MANTHRPLTVVALLLSTFMAALEATVIATVMPTVIAELGGLSLYGWVGAAYLLASTVCVPIYGKVADLFGRKRVLLFGIALFLVGSVASGLADSIGGLIFARIVQGIGAGAMQPISLTILGDIFTLEERGRIQGLFGSVWAVAAVSGPLVGGAIMHALSWRWVFWINVPFGLAAAAILVRAFKEKPQEHGEIAIDWAGAAMLTLATLGLLTSASGVAPVLTLIAGVACTVAFVFAEQRAKDPILPLPLIRERTIAVGTISSAILGATMMGALTYVPLYAQGVEGRTPTEAGAAVAPLLLGWPIASAATSRLLVRTGFRAPVWLGSIVTACALAVLPIVLGRHAPLLHMQAAAFVFGIGLGLANTALLIAVQSSVPWNQRGVATATSMFARMMGGALGVGGLGSFLAIGLGSSFTPDEVAALLDPHRRAEATAASAAHDAAGALGAALQPIFWALLALGLLNLAAVAFYPRAPAATSTSE